MDVSALNHWDISTAHIFFFLKKRQKLGEPKTQSQSILNSVWAKDGLYTARSSLDQAHLGEVLSQLPKQREIQAVDCLYRSASWGQPQIHSDSTR